MNVVRPIVLITGAAGEVGGAVIKALNDNYEVVAMDEPGADVAAPLIGVDLTNDVSFNRALEQFRSAYGAHIASVVHLAAYFDYSGEDNPLYQRLNIDGTCRLIDALQRFHVEQFIYSGTMLVHAPTRPGGHISENQPLDPKWAYPKSKAEAEAVLRARHGAIPCVLFHLAGLYSDQTAPPTIAHQIARIFERHLESHLYSGDLTTGQSLVHRDDLADAFRRAVDNRAQLPDEITILIGEPEPPSYRELQDEIGGLLYGKEWSTVRVPAALAAAGAWVQEKTEPLLPPSIGGGYKPFIRPFMAKLASDHYALDIARAQKLLSWRPHHRFVDALVKIIDELKRDPVAWYKANKVAPPPGLARNRDE